MAIIRCQSSPTILLPGVPPYFRTATHFRLPHKFAGNAFKRTGLPSLTKIPSRTKSEPVQGLFGGLFGRKSKSEVPPQPKLLLHEDIELPFPPSLLAGTFLAGIVLIPRLIKLLLQTSDVLLIALLSSWIAPGKELRCCYKASRDGFQAASFHQRCDFTGPCVVVAMSTTGLHFGAFNPEGYRSTDDYYDTFDAFLFYWESSSSHDDDSKLVVLNKVGGSGAALFDYARGGPQFGADGLLIGPPKAPVMGGFAGPDTNSGGGDLREAKSRLGLSYAIRPDGKGSLFGDNRSATLDEVEVFCCPAIAALY